MNQELKILKKEIRQGILKRRDALSQTEIIEKSKEIFTKIKHLEAFKKAAMVMSFVSFGSEVDTTEFILYCLNCGKSLAVPKIVMNSNGQKEMVAVEIKNIAEDLEPGIFGIKEPREGAGRMVLPCDIDFIIVPGSAFDQKGNRIGYGGGFYDRFLRGTDNNCIKAGVAFDLQILDDLPVEDHDLPVDIVVTERNVL